MSVPQCALHCLCSSSFSLTLLSLSFSCLAHGREEQHFQLKLYYVASLILHERIAEITASYCLYLMCIRRWCDYQDFVQINILEGRAGYISMGRISVTFSYSLICLTTEPIKYINVNSFIENLAASKYSMWAQRGKQIQ